MLERQEQTDDGKLISRKMSAEIEYDTVQSFNEIGTYLQNTFISTNWLFYRVFPKRDFSNQCCLLCLGDYE